MRTLQMFLKLKYQELMPINKEDWVIFILFLAVLSSVFIGCAVIGAAAFGVAYLINPEYYYSLASFSVRYPTSTIIPHNFLTLSFILGAQIVITSYFSVFVGYFCWKSYQIFIEFKNFLRSNCLKAQLIVIKEREDGR